MNNSAAMFFNSMVNSLGNQFNNMMVGKIESYNDATNLTKIVPLHNIPNENEEYSPLINVPMGFFNLGGFTIKVSPKVGDIVLLLYCDYDIENLKINGTKQQKTNRTHALDDAIALPLSINFLNTSFSNNQDLTISKNGTTSYIKIKEDGTIVLNAPSIKLGESATQKVLIQGGTYGTPSSKVYAE
jgi:hypothetical protein